MNPLFYGFFSIENFRSKLGFTSKMLLAKYKNDARAKNLPEIIDRLMQGSAKRNKLVHRRVHGYANGKIGRRYALIEWPKHDEKPPRRAAAGTPVSPPSSALCLREINAIRLEFFALFVTLTNLYLRLSNVELSFQESDEQPRRPPPTQKLIDQMHGVLGHPPKPSKRRLRRDAEAQGLSNEGK
jgi:hypothetical protein